MCLSGTGTPPRPSPAAAYESREATTRSGGTRRLETATRFPTTISASGSSRVTIISSRKTPPTATRTGSSFFRRRPTRESAAMSSSAIRRFSFPRAFRAAQASTSGINRFRARRRSTRTSVSPPSTPRARIWRPARFRGNLGAEGVTTWARPIHRSLVASFSAPRLVSPAPRTPDYARPWLAPVELASDTDAARRRRPAAALR